MAKLPVPPYAADAPAAVPSWRRPVTMCLSFVIVMTCLALTYPAAAGTFLPAAPSYAWRRSAKQRRLLAEAEGSARAEEVEDRSMGPMDTLKFVGAIGVYVAFFYAVAASLTGLTGAA